MAESEELHPIPSLLSVTVHCLNFSCYDPTWTHGSQQALKFNSAKYIQNEKQEKKYHLLQKN